MQYLRNVTITHTLTHIHARTHTHTVCPRAIMVKAMDSGIVVSEFELKSRYNIHSRTNNFGKGMNPLILPAMG